MKMHIFLVILQWKDEYHPLQTSLTFREEHKLRVLRRTSVPKIEEVMEGYTNVHS